MLLTIVGPGRAGMSLGLAATGAGHSICAVAGRDRATVVSAAEQLGAVPRDLTDPLPESDLVVIAVRDDAIGLVAEQLARVGPGAPATVHVSGLAPITALNPIAELGLAVGSFHPLQTLPTSEVGAAALDGAWVAVTADDPTLRERLGRLAESLGARPFSLADDHKATYHAGAAAAANFTLAALTMAQDLFEAAGVPFEASRPLVEAVVANAYHMGPRPALTGPVARGDVGTVEAQIKAVEAADPSLVAGYVAFVAELARLTGRAEAFEPLIADRRRGAR